MRVFLSLFFVLSVSLVFSQADASFERANASYAAGNYELALAGYQQVVDQGVQSSDVYFNMGNAHFKLQNLGEAIYYYEKALLLDPNNERASNNLGFAQASRLDAFEEKDRTDFFTNIASRGSDYWAWWTIGCAVLAAIMLFLFLRGRGIMKRLGLVLFLVGLMGVGTLFWLAGIAEDQGSKLKTAIILSEQVDLKEEPSDTAPTSLELHEGTKVILQQSVPGWQEIELPNGSLGWLPSSSLRAL